MNKVILTLSLLIFAFCVSAQTQKEALKSFNQKGNSYLGFDLGFRGGGTTTNNFSAFVLNFIPAINYQYNITNRLSIGGSVSNDLHLNYRSDEENIGVLQSLGASVKVRYYPFKSNGFFVEGEYGNQVRFFPNTRPQRTHKVALSPGYTFMVGKNRNLALDLKMSSIYLEGRRIFQVGYSHVPTIGLRVPIGKARLKSTTLK